MKSTTIFSALFVALFGLVTAGCGGGNTQPAVVENAQVQTEQELADYDAEMEATDPIEE